MARQRRNALIAATLVALAACAGELELPEPPDVSDREQRYDTPTGVLSSSTAQSFLERFVTRLAELDDVDQLRGLRKAMIRFDDEVEVEGTGADATTSLGDVALRTDALVTVGVDCPGWSGGSVNRDAIELSVVVRASQIVPTAWGPIQACQFEIDRQGATRRGSVSGDVIVYLPNLLDKSAPRVIFIAYTVDELVLDDAPVTPWSGELRVVDDRVEILVELDGLGTIVFHGSSTTIGVRAANGNWTCNAPERRCTSDDNAGDSFSY